MLGGGSTQQAGTSHMNQERESGAHKSSSSWWEKGFRENVCAREFIDAGGGGCGERERERVRVCVLRIGARGKNLRVWDIGVSECNRV